MVAKRYTRIITQKGGKIRFGTKIGTRLGAIPHYGKQALKGTAIGTGALVAAPVAAGLSLAKAGTVAAGTAIISAPIRAIQGAVKTPWQLGRLGFQKVKERLARRKLTAAGMHNYENLKNRVSKRKSTLNTLRTQKNTLNKAQYKQSLGGQQGTVAQLSSWWKGKQIARKEKAIKKAEDRLQRSIGSKAVTTGATPNHNKTVDISERANRFITALNDKKKAQMEKYDANLTVRRTDKTAPITAKITELSNLTHPQRAAFATAQTQKKKSEETLAAKKVLFSQFDDAKFGPNGKATIGGIEYDRATAIAEAQKLSKNIKTDEKQLATNTAEFNKSQKAINALDAEVANLTKQKDAFMAQGKTAEQLYGSFQRRKARVQQTKKDLGQTAQQLLGISTIKNVGRAVGASLTQDAGLLQRGIKETTGEEIGKPIDISMGTLGKAVGKSLMSSRKNISSRYTAMKEGIAPIGLKIETLWRGYVNKFSKQGKLLDSMLGKVGDDGDFATKAKAISEEYQKLKPGELVPTELRERHQALINQREIMQNFADLIVKNRSTAKDPNIELAANSVVGKGARALEITLPLQKTDNLETDRANLQEHIAKAEGAFKNAKDYPTRMQNLELYNHLKSIKRYNESANFETTAKALGGKLNTLLDGLEVLPEFKQ